MLAYSGYTTSAKNVVIKSILAQIIKIINQDILLCAIDREIDI